VRLCVCVCEDRDISCVETQNLCVDRDRSVGTYREFVLRHRSYVWTETEFFWGTE
jgi:hypothetical protein